jgi:tripartite-type tricarboxylate transporter receptor subunit TctC
MTRIVSLLLLALCTAVPAFSQPYPSKPVRFIVTFAAGGGTDLIARTVAPKVSEGLGQPVVVENRAGANGAIGADAVAKSAPDGYTVCVCAAGTLAVAPHLTKLPFDPLKDLTPVAQLANSPFVVTVNPGVKAESLRELIALAKAQPGKINFGSSGNGGSPHLSTELLKIMAGIDMVHVAYKGLGPGITDLLGGQIQLMLADVNLVVPHIKSGKLRALAVTGANRSPALPDVPTVAEAGVPGYVAGTWYAVLAPAGTPSPIVSRLSEEIRKALAMPEVRSALIAQGVEPAGSTPAQLASFLHDEHAKWGKVIREAKIKID